MFESFFQALVDAALWTCLPAALQSSSPLPSATDDADIDTTAATAAPGVDGDADENNDGAGKNEYKVFAFLQGGAAGSDAHKVGIYVNVCVCVYICAE